MRDPRVTNLARILVEHSAQVKQGDVCTIEGGSAAEPLLQAVYEEVLRAGGNPIVQMALDEQQPAFFEHASEAQLEWVSPTSEWIVENADVRIAVMASQNTRALSQVPPERQTKVQAARQHLMKRMMERAAAGEYRWALTLFPTNAYASEAGMSLSAYEDFYYGACLATEDDPVAAWRRQSEETERLKEWIEGRSEVHVTGEGTDLRLGIEGRKFIAAGGRHNMPDGEFFTGPVEDSAEGEVTFHLPATYAGREVSGVRFRFEVGKGRRRERGEGRGVPDPDARHRRGGAAAGRARHRDELRHHRRHRRDPARREDRRHRSPRRGPVLPGDGRGERVGHPLGHDLRPPARRPHRGGRRAPADRRSIHRLAAVPPHLSACTGVILRRSGRLEKGRAGPGLSDSGRYHLMHSRKRGRLALLGSLALTLCVTVGLVGAADAAKKKGKKKPSKATIQKTNISIADRAAGGPQAAVTPVDLVVPGSFGKKQVGNVDLTLQVTGSADDYLFDLEARLVAPNGRTARLEVPASGALTPAQNRSFGPTRYTPNSSVEFCFDPTPPCTDPDDSLGPPFAGTVRELVLTDFNGIKMKGTWRLKLLDFEDNGFTGTLNLAKLEIKAAKPPPV